MILRIWQCRATAGRAHLYPRHLAEAVLPKLRAQSGFRGAYLLRRGDSDEVEFVVQTLWESMDAIEQFAGSTPHIAVVDSDARAMLTTFDATVRHFDVLLGP
jgi:heme-degrading monooxygenase HmoA